MLQKILFQDNIFQLSRLIDVLYEGLHLELADDFYYNKTLDDILFFNDTILKLFNKIIQTPQIPEYTVVLQSLFNCQKKYVQLLDLILDGNSSLQEYFKKIIIKIQSIKNQQVVLSQEIAQKLQKPNNYSDFKDLVSHNELSELLQF